MTLFDEMDIRRELKRACRELGGCIYFAQRHGLDLTSVMAAHAGVRSPTAEIYHALGFERVTRFVKTSPNPSSRSLAS